MVMIGLAGFCFWPVLIIGAIGTVLCAVGMARQPKGLAIAGLIIGIIEIVTGVVILLFFGALCGGLGLAASEAGKAVLTENRGREISTAIEQYHTANSTLPTDLSMLKLPVDKTTDGYGNAYLYTPQGSSYQLSSMGSDGKPGTADDVVIPKPTTRPSSKSSSRLPSSTANPSEDKGFLQNVVSKANYDRLTNGMSYSNAVKIIGFSGEEMSRNHIDGAPGVMESIDTVMYSWQNRDGTNMNAMFQNDKLMQKSQFGLK